MKSRALQMARNYGVRVELAYLGDWGASNLYAEYEPRGPIIRLDREYVRALSGAKRYTFVSLAIGHELYHHCERIGAVQRIHDRVARENAADAFARALLPRA